MIARDLLPLLGPVPQLARCTWAHWECFGRDPGAFEGALVGRRDVDAGALMDRIPALERRVPRLLERGCMTLYAASPRTLACVDETFSLVLVDTQTLAVTRVMDTEPYYWSCKFSPSGATLAYVKLKSVYLINVATGASTMRPMPSHLEFAFVSETQLAIADDHGLYYEIQLLDLVTGEGHTVPHDALFNDVSFGPSALCGLYDDRVVIADYTGAVIRSIPCLATTVFMLTDRCVVQTERNGIIVLSGPSYATTDRMDKGRVCAIGAPDAFAVIRKGSVSIGTRVIPTHDMHVLEVYATGPFVFLQTSFDLYRQRIE